MKKLLFLSFIFFLNINIFSETTEIKILFTTDTNGHPLSFIYNNDDGQGGLPARATLLKTLAGDKKKNNVLIVDSGNAVFGRPESTLYNGITDVTGMNFCEYDVMGLGLSEIWNGKKVFDNINKSSNFNLLSSNIKVLTSAAGKTYEYLADDKYIKTFGTKNPVKIGVFSVINDDISGILPDTLKKEFKIDDPITSAKKTVDELKNKEKVDIVIALTYLGYGEDSSQNTSKLLAESTPDIDIIIDGRNNMKQEEAISNGNAKICTGYKYGLFVGEIKLTVENKKIIDFQYKLHPVNYKENGNLIGEKIEEDKKTLSGIQAKMKNFNSLMSKKIVTIKSGNFSMSNIRFEENEFGNLICDALLDFTKADIALQNSGGIYDASIDIKNITRKSFNDSIKFDNSVVIISMTGSQIKETLEYSCSRAGYGGFLQVAGIKFTYSKGSNQVSNIKINNQDIVQDRKYNVVTNSWLADGGDGHVVFRSIPVKTDLGIFYRDVVYNYLEKQKNYTPILDGRINIID